MRTRSTTPREARGSSPNTPFAAATDTRPSGRPSAALVALLAAACVVALWWAFISTTTGQRIEGVALDSSLIGRRTLAAPTLAVLDLLSLPFLAIVTLGGVAVTIARRQWMLAVAIPLFVFAANATTQVLKNFIISRPDFGLPHDYGNSFPSGHTTVAATAAVVAVLAVPSAWRWLAALLGWGFAAVTGVATMVNGWHRASDVVAALLVVLAWAALTLAIVGAQPSTTRGATANTFTSLLLTRTGAIAAVLAAVALVITWWGVEALNSPARVALLIAYAGAWLAVAAVSCLAAAMLLRLSTRR